MSSCGFWPGGGGGQVPVLDAHACPANPQRNCTEREAGLLPTLRGVAVREFPDGVVKGLSLRQTCRLLPMLDELPLAGGHRHRNEAQVFAAVVAYFFHDLIMVP